MSAFTSYKTHAMKFEESRELTEPGLGFIRKLYTHRSLMMPDKLR